MKNITRLQVAAGLLLALFLSQSRPVLPTALETAYQVDRLVDSGPGSLRQAILDANADPGAGTITFGASGTILLASSLPGVSDPAGLVIDGAGKSITISGGGAVQVMAVRSGAVLVLNDLALVSGSSGSQGGSRGGALFNEGMLTIISSRFSGHSASQGGAVFNAGWMSVAESEFTASRADYQGGDIANTGLLEVANSTFTDSSAGEYGGGIANRGTLLVSSSTFTGNSAPGGGGIFNNNQLSITASTFSGNTAGSAGGAVLNGSPEVVAITDSILWGNSASQGGGIWNGLGKLELASTTVAGSPSGGNCWGVIEDGGGNLSYPDSTCAANNASP